MSIEVGMKGPRRDCGEPGRYRPGRLLRRSARLWHPVYVRPDGGRPPGNPIALHLEPGQSTVGTKLCVSHDSASPVGIKVWAESEITLVDGKRIELKVAAYDEKGLIGQGTHEALYHHR